MLRDSARSAHHHAPVLVLELVDVAVAVLVRVDVEELVEVPVLDAELDALALADDDTLAVNDGSDTITQIHNKIGARARKRVIV